MVRARGFSLLELLVALALSLTLIAACLRVLQHSRGLFAGNESIAQVHDAARHALGVMAGDIEHAGFFGFARADRVELTWGGAVLATGDELRQPAPDRPATSAPGLPEGADDCGINFAVDLSRPVQAADNGFAPGAGDCGPTESAGGAMPGADTLTLRHASLETTDPRAGRLQVLSRAASSQPLRIFADGRVPGVRDDASEVRDLDVRTYYVANQSVGDPALPALRVKSLTESRGRAQFRDEEIMPGVEDLQVELGVRDAGDPAGALRFVTADAPGVATAAVVAVRLWLRVRSSTREPGLRETREFQYSNTRYAPVGGAAEHRRLLVSRTVSLRNRP